MYLAAFRILVVLELSLVFNYYDDKVVLLLMKAFYKRVIDLFLFECLWSDVYIYFWFSGFEQYTWTY